MKIEELVTRLDTHWPFGGADQIALAIADYAAVLENYEGRRLEIAWNSTLASWTKFHRPLPADIRSNIPHDAPAAKSDNSTGLNMRQLCETAKATMERLIEAWHRDNADWLRQFVDSFPEHDRLYVEGMVEALVRDRADKAGWEQARGRAATVIVSERDIARIRERSHIPPITHATGANAPKLKPIHVPMPKWMLEAQRPRDALVDPYKKTDDDEGDDVRFP